MNAVDATRIVSFGEVDQRLVFLDARSDSYFMLEPSEERAFLELFGPTDSRDNDEVLDGLLGTEGECHSLLRANPPSARNSLFDDRSQLTVSLKDLLSVAAAVRQTRRMLQREPLGLVLDLLTAALPSQRAAGDTSTVQTRGRLFAASRKYVPIKPNCLLDSLALLHWLGSDAHGALLVFGAKLEPFFAHCWVQIGDLLLNDRREYVELFKPVRVVECLPGTP